MIIGITGNIGSGKSTAAAYLRELNAATLDADKVGHSIMEPGRPAYEALIELFGKDFLDKDGVLDRKMLGQYIFSDSSGYLREKLNEVTHPLIIDEIQKWIGEQQKAGHQLIAVEAALLLDSGLAELVDRVWLIRAPKEALVERVMKRDSLSEWFVERRLAAQMKEEDMAARADLIIDNDGSPEEFAAKIQAAAAALAAE